MTLLTIHQTAERLRISRRSVYRLVNEGQLIPVGRVLGRMRFMAEDVDALVVRESCVTGETMERIVNETLATCHH